MKNSAPLTQERVTPMTLYSFDDPGNDSGNDPGNDSRFRSRSSAFAALASLAAANYRLHESLELYKLAIEEGEERWGADSPQVRVLLAEIANVYASLGETKRAVFYRRRSKSI